MENQEEKDQSIVEAPQKQTTHSPTTEHNMSMLRKKLEAEEHARQAIEQRYQELERSVKQNLSNNNTPPTPPILEETDGIDIDNEDYVQAKHIKTSNKKISTKVSAAEKRLLELEQKLAYFEAKVDTDTLKDFNEVVSEENLKTFAKLYPDDYQTMMANPNLKAKSKTAYNMIKNYGIIDAHNSVNTFLDAEQKLQKNNQKPQASSSVSPQQPQTPLTRIGDYERRVLTEADRDRILAEVERKKASW